MNVQWIPFYKIHVSTSSQVAFSYSKHSMKFFSPYHFKIAININGLLLFILVPNYINGNLMDDVEIMHK